MNWRRPLVAAVLGVVLMGVLASPARAHVTILGIGWVEREDSGYTYHIPVCLHSNFGEDDWDLSTALHDAANDMMVSWNNIGGELYFYRSNSACQTLYEGGIPYVQLGWSAYLGGDVLGWFQALEFTTPCDTWLPDGECFTRGSLWISSTEPVYIGSGSPLPYQYDGRSILLHEFGHASGVAHSHHASDVMWPVLSAGLTFRTLTSRDKDGYIWYYGTTH